MVGGGADNACAAVGTGVVGEGDALTSVGTSGLIYTHMDKYRPIPDGSLHLCCSAVPGTWFTMGGPQAASLSLEWFKNNFCKGLIKEAQDKIQEIREKKQEALKHDTLLPTWLEEFKQYEHIKTLERRVVVELIDHIDVHSKTEIEIHFCFEDELHSITEKFMEYQAHHGNEVAEE